jgi:simple sugar transport system permease protein
MGGLISLSAGDLNISLEGFMLIVPFFAVLGSYLLKLLFGIAFALMATVIYGLLFGLFTIRLKADVFVVGMPSTFCFVKRPCSSRVCFFMCAVILVILASKASLTSILRFWIIFRTLTSCSTTICLCIHFLGHDLYFLVLIYRTPYGFYFRAAGEHPEALGPPVSR